MFIRIIHLSLLVCTASATAGGGGLTQEKAVVLALKHNPSLAAARLSIEEARGRLRQSGRLMNPELEFEFSRTPRSRESATRVGLMQRFPLTRRLQHERAVSRALLAAAECEVKEAERKLSLEVSGLAIKLLAIKEQRELRSTQVASLRELASFQRKAAEAGEGLFTEAQQVELEVQQVEVERLQLATEEGVLLSEFRLLLGAAAQEAQTVSGPLPAPVGVGFVENREPRPDVQAARARSEAARFSLREQQARRLEDIGIGFSYSHERTVDEPNPMTTERVIGFRVTLPLPLWNDNAGRIYEASAAASRTQKEREALELAALEETVAARQAMEAYAQIFGAIDARALPQALALEKELRAGHTSGQTPLGEVLRTRIRCLELQRQRIDVLRDYHLARLRVASVGNQSRAVK